MWATPVVDDASEDELEDASAVTEESGRQSPSAIEESREVWALSLLDDTSPDDCACGADLWSVTDARETSALPVFLRRPTADRPRSMRTWSRSETACARRRRSWI